MTHARLISLAVGHALAADAPVGDALRALNRPAAAALADAGSLPEALRVAGLSPTLVALATTWPGAVLPAVRRLGRIPPAFRFQAPLVQLLAYLAFALFGLASTQLVISSRLIPSLETAFERTIDAPGYWPLFAALGALVMGAPMAGALVLGMVGSPRLPGWGRELRTAQEASVAAALWESGAPAELRNRISNGFLHPEAAGGDAADADRRAAAALAHATRHHARFVAAMRLFGLGSLALWAFGTLVRVYVLVSQSPGGL